MDIHILQTSDIKYNLDKEKSLIMFSHSFELSNGQKINTTLTYHSKEIPDVEAFKTTLLPEIQKIVQVAISYGLGDKADQVVLVSGKLARFKKDKQVSFTKDAVDYKAYQNLDTLLELKTQKLAKSSDENKKARIGLINKIAHVLTSGTSVDQKKPETKPKPATKLKSILKSKPSVQKKNVTFDESLRFQDAINTIHRLLKRMNEQSKNINWENFAKLQRIFLETVEKVESTKIEGDYEYTWASSKKRINDLIQSIEARRPVKVAAAGA